MSDKYVKIGKPQISKDQLIHQLSFSDDVGSYFNSDVFFAKYDVELKNVSHSILSIPVVANVLPVAWAIGAEVIIDDLDKNFVAALSKIKQVMKEWYPKFTFSDLTVKNAVTNNFPVEKYALLFSGGIDSTFSYIRHESKKPILIMVMGADIPLTEKDFWEKIKQKYLHFAESNQIQIKFIETNMRQFLNEKQLTKNFGPFLPERSWWGGVQHGIGLLSLCAPLAVTEKIGTILMASSFPLGYIDRGLPWGSHPRIDNKISWAGVHAVQDAPHVSRQSKIREVLSPYIKSPSKSLFLRVCYSRFDDLNCGKCEKCLRTITGLLLENIDPNECGFNIDDNFLVDVRTFISEVGRGFFYTVEGSLWKEMQECMPENFTSNMYSSKVFFDWFKTFDFAKSRRKSRLKRWLNKLHRKIS